MPEAGVVGAPVAVADVPVVHQGCEDHIAGRWLCIGRNGVFEVEE
jgi:hypothetical protein